MIANDKRLRILLWCIIFFVGYKRHLSDAIQCFSCKASASNEIEANIQCLEKANLEDCSEFYEYYTDVEKGNEVDEDIYDYEMYNDYVTPPSLIPQLPPPAIPREIPRDAWRPPRFRREAGDAYKMADKMAADDGDYQYEDPVTSSTAPPGDNHSTFNGVNESNAVKSMTLPKDPEHHCYSMTTKNGWESYTVEKGCKKITYCRANVENSPAEWTLPWNFCCDRSRCNAKLVKDKPQRIFAMGCRRTDDCIQGHTTRRVCPELFQSCPRVSSNVIKMECRVRGRGPGVQQGFSGPGPVFGSAYFNQFKDKKCFCAPGFYPRGPICSHAGLTVMSTSTRDAFLSMVISCWLFYVIFSDVHF